MNRSPVHYRINQNNADTNGHFLLFDFVKRKGILISNEFLALAAPDRSLLDDNNCIDAWEMLTDLPCQVLSQVVDNSHADGFC
jgi:hypothetical protein